MRADNSPGKERLGQVVIRALFQTNDAITTTTTRREHHDRKVIPCIPQSDAAR